MRAQGQRDEPSHWPWNAAAAQRSALVAARRPAGAVAAPRTALAHCGARAIARGCHGDHRLKAAGPSEFSSKAGGLRDWAAPQRRVAERPVPLSLCALLSLTCDRQWVSGCVSLRCAAAPTRTTTVTTRPTLKQPADRGRRGDREGANMARRRLTKNSAGLARRRHAH